MKSSAKATFFLVLPVLLVWIGADVFAHAQSPIQSVAARNGERIFVQSCSPCHDVHTSASRVGPSLKSYYSDHEPRPTDAQVRAIISQGKGKMPKFSNLSNTQTDDLIAYLKTL